MKRTVKGVSLVSLILTLAASLALIVSCTGKPNTSDKANSDGDVQGLDISEYRIVRPYSASDDLVKATIAIKNRIEKSAKVELKIGDDRGDDSEYLSSVKEILVGETDRSETESAKAKLDGVTNKKAFIIEVTDSKIVILGKSDDITVRALKYFATNFLSSSKEEGTLAIKKGFSKMAKANTDTIILCENLIEFSVSKEIEVMKPEGNFDTNSWQYPKMLLLCNQPDEKNNGTLLATLNSGEHFYRILKSVDNGDTWEEIARVFDGVNAKLNGGRMPYLYELPVDMGEYKKGTVILAGTSSASNVNLTTITFYASTDLGKTWNTLYNIDKGGWQNDDSGVWEPFLMYEEENGRLYCFYSDDSDPEHDQKLVYKYTTDMKNWVGKEGIVGENGVDGTPFDVVCCDDPDYRPGMISVIRMNNGEYLAVYDIVVYAPGRNSGEIIVDGVKYKYNPDLYKKSDSIDSWDVADPGTVIRLEDGRYMGLSPWVTYSPTVTENGMVVVYGRRWASSDTGETDLFLSFDYGETFATLDNPFDYTVSGTTCGYSPALIFSADGKTLYYMTNPENDGFVKANKLSMVRIEIIE